MDRDKTLGLKTSGATALLLVRNDDTEIYHNLSLLISAFLCLMNKRLLLSPATLYAHVP